MARSYLLNEQDRRKVSELFETGRLSSQTLHHSNLEVPEALLIPVFLPQGGLKGEIWGISGMQLDTPSSFPESHQGSEEEEEIYLAQRLKDFQDYPLFTLEAISPITHETKFCILAEDIEARTTGSVERGGRGKAAVLGVSYVKIRVTSEEHTEYARLTTNKEYLDSDPDGPIVVLFREDVTVPDPEDEDADVFAHAFVLLGPATSTTCPDLKELYVDGNPTAGEFILSCTFNGETENVTLEYDSTATEAQAAFEEHSEVDTEDDPDNLVVTGGPLPWKSLNILLQANLKKNGDIDDIMNNVTPEARMKIRAINLDAIEDPEE